MSQKVLVVEDDEDICDLMVMHLKRENLEVSAAQNGEQGLKLIEAAHPPFDLIVLDWMLPNLTGLDLLKRWKKSIPVLMVTARASTSDIVLGLESGADDYITKPFELPIFIARVRSLLRRTLLLPSLSKSCIQYNNLTLDADAHEVHLGDQLLELTVSEFKLLHGLLQNQGKVLSREALMKMVQGEGVVVTDRAIDTHVFGLRKKLGVFSESIETIRGVGYRISPQ